MNLAYDDTLIIAKEINMNVIKFEPAQNWERPGREISITAEQN
jgi:hypothetical protein